VGVTGELYIGGAGVARGYLNRPELTAARFLKDPFTDDPNARMYRTGDLGRWLADGNIEFLGRNDFQVKIRGFRIELGEIEARLSEHEGVQEAVVLAREDTPGDKRLVAYYTAREQNSGGTEALRAHLAAKLPEYMVPAAYVRLESLPLTANGKLDRKALPAPEGDAYVVRQYEAPQGAIEELLAGIWAELFNRERVGRHDNFFELGGHSLMAVTLVERLARAGLKADVRALFGTPTLAELAASFDTHAPALETPANRIPSPAKNTSSPRIVELSI
jgi:aryl carrier-like protein